MHWKRWLTALVIIPLLILSIFKGGTALFLLITMLAGTISLMEYYRIVFKNHNPAVPAIYSLLAYTVGASIFVTAYYHQWAAILAILIIDLILVAALSIFRFKKTTDAPFVAIKQVFGIIYIPLSLCFIILIHRGADGPLWTFFLIWVVSWGDTGALYTGTFFGRHKLCPAVSPKKTIEGAMGGLLANIGFGWLYKVLFFNTMPAISCIVFSICVGIIGQLGDLFESEFKRAVGVKDSGRILPGHGGFLDRLDALLFATPIAYFLKEFILP